MSFGHLRGQIKQYKHCILPGSPSRYDQLFVCDRGGHNVWLLTLTPSPLNCLPRISINTMIGQREEPGPRLIGWHS
ncbi:hypothetical protein Bpfe_001762 [Biomphalaria pfeifferi]|uniref:Uncharacterized protein n=1 Tax=Biomphalaria pfeifferi TaxID=112525 RepID=A0AAD8CAN6_BIOPF|nr:hypothetical protein Bpfe_001762 [Biomphalaria pfeifferi]